MDTVNVLSGGAALGLVRALQDGFQASCGAGVNGTFGAVGAMKQKLLDGAPCDVLILTRALIDQLTESGQVLPGSARALGTVMTGVAVKSGTPHPNVANADALRTALRAASGIYFPDPQLATAGIHFMKVLSQLGLAEEVADRLRTFPNGATAMKAMADCTDAHVIGCTQVTEIIITPGIDLVANLPAGFELATVYVAAVCRQAANDALARQLIDLMGSESSAGLRASGGFLPG